MTISLNNPVVLLNGLIFPQRLGPIGYFHEMEKKFPEIEFKYINLGPWSTQKDRLATLKTELQKLPVSFHLLGHSQGAVDARWMIEDLELRKKMLTLTSINAPFAGTPIVEYFPIVKSRWSHLLELITNPLLPQIHVPQFCANTFIHKTSEFKHYPLFRKTEPLLRKRIGKNDGFVGLDSMRMGEEILLMDGDHLSTVGWPIAIGEHLLHSLSSSEFFTKIFENLHAWESRQ